MTISEFLKLPKDLQSYIYTTGEISLMEFKSLFKDDEEKIGFYIILKKIKRNIRNEFYSTSSIKEYIVYDKNTNKVRMSSSTNNVIDFFLDKYFKYSSVYRMAIPYLTKTLVKKIIRGDIKTVRDIVSYHKIYTLRNKNVEDTEVLRFLDSKATPLQCLNFLSDSSDITSKKLFSLNCCFRYIVTMNIKDVKTEDLEKIPKIYENWRDEKAIEYDKFKRSKSNLVSTSDISEC